MADGSVRVLLAPSCGGGFVSERSGKGVPLIERMPAGDQNQNARTTSAGSNTSGRGMSTVCDPGPVVASQNSGAGSAPRHPPPPPGNHAGACAGARKVSAHHPPAAAS